MAADESLFEDIVRRASEEQPRNRANPYPGIRPFDEDTRENFFGRETQITHVLGHLERTHFAAVVGGSGCGKSSIVRAGVVPRIRSFGIQDAGDVWRVAIFKPQRSPLECLARALNDQVLNFKVARERRSDELEKVIALLRAPGSTFNDFLERFREDIAFGGAPAHDSLILDGFRRRVNLLIVADQFEEMFREPNRDSKDAKRVVDLLHDVFKRQYRRIFVIITMRSEDLHECAAYQELPDAINAGAYLVRRLNWEERREAILRPALRALGWALQADYRNQSLPFDERTLTTIQRSIEALHDDPDHLPLLQHLLWRLWDDAERAGRLAEAGEEPHEIFKLPDLARILELAPAALSRIVDDRGANLGFVLRGGAPRRSSPHLKGALELHADRLYDTLTLRRKAIAEIVFRLLAERDRHGQEKRHWTDKAKIREVLGHSPGAGDGAGSSEQGLEEDIAAVLECFGIASARSEKDAGERHRTQRHPFLSMSQEGVIDVSHEAFIRKWATYQNLLSAEEAAGGAYKAIVASFRRTSADASPYEQAPEETAAKRVTRRLRTYVQPFRVRWNLLFARDSVVTSAEKRDAVRRWLRGRDFEFENREADRLRSSLQRRLRRLGRLGGLERLTELGRSVHFARRYNEHWSERYIPEIDKVQPEERKPILAENQKLFPQYAGHAKACMRWHWGAKVVVPCLLFLGAPAVLGAALYWRQAGEVQAQLREFADLHSRAVLPFTLAKSDQFTKLANPIVAPTLPLPEQVYRAQLIEAATALSGHRSAREELRALGGSENGWDEQRLRLEQKLKYFQVSVAAMAARVMDHFISVKQEPGAAFAAASQDLSKDQIARFQQACPDHPDSGELIAAAEWQELQTLSGEAARGAPVWKVVYSSPVPLPTASQSGPPVGQNVQRQIQLTFGVVENCGQLQILDALSLPDFDTPIDFRGRDLGVFVQLSPGDEHSNVYRVAWHYSCGTDSACDRNRRFSTQLDLGRTYLNTRIPADAVEMAADAELLIAPRKPNESDLRQMLIGASKSPGDCQEKLFDRWTVTVQGKSVVVSDGVMAISVSPDFIENHERARIVDCAVFTNDNEVAWVAYGVDLFGRVSAGRDVNGPAQPRVWLFLQVLELKQDYLEFLAKHAGAALRNRSNGALAASDVDFEVKLVEEVLREPVWSKEIWRKESAGIAIGEMILDEHNITLNREDSLQAFKLAWSADALLSQACALLGGDGNEEPPEYHSAEFRMFKRDLTQPEGGELEGAAPGEPNVDGICGGVH